MKLPSFQFCPGDWMKDPSLRSVSLEARGLWIDMLCLLFESGRRGYLQHATGKPVTEEQLARMTGCSAKQVSRLLQELENSGVFSRTEHGTIYSRRMVKDEQVRQAKIAAGKLGGNPQIVGKKVNREVNHNTNQQPNQKGGLHLLLLLHLQLQKQIPPNPPSGGWTLKACF